MRYLILGLMVVFTSAVFGINPRPSLNQTRMTYGLIGDMVFHPGVFFRYDYDFATFQKRKPKEKKDSSYNKIKNRSFFGTGNAGLFWHPRTQTSFYNTYGIGYRKEVNEKRYRNVDLSFGYQVNFLPNTYRVAEDFTVEETGVTARGYGVISPSIGYGRNFKRSHFKPDHGLHFRPRIKYLDGYSLTLRSNLLLNYNTTVITSFQLELGLMIGKRVSNVSIDF